MNEQAENGTSGVPTLLTVGELRAAMDGLPDDARIDLWMDFQFALMTPPIEFSLYAVGASVVASDCCVEPVGTDPETEGTVGVLVIELATEARRG